MKEEEIHQILNSPEFEEFEDNIFVQLAVKGYAEYTSDGVTVRISYQQEEGNSEGSTRDSGPVADDDGHGAG